MNAIIALATWLGTTYSGIWCFVWMMLMVAVISGMLMYHLLIHPEQFPESWLEPKTGDSDGHKSV